jgi:hypothetical protein
MDSSDFLKVIICVENNLQCIIVLKIAMYN